MTDDEIKQFADKKAAEIGEHFDAVQVLVTWQENGLTRDYFCGSGNFHARLNMARELVSRDRAGYQALEIARTGEADDEDE